MKETTPATGKHTPGPWKATNLEGPWLDGGDGGCVEAVTPDGRYVRREICDYMLDTGEDGDLDEDIANAHLIAAAPDLLEALKACLECEYPVTDREAITKAVAAIAKAEGGAA